jgi:hypothetical protein
MEHARQCVARAQLAGNAEDRVTQLELAQAWANMSEHAEEIGGLVEEARKHGLLPLKSKMN